MSERRKAKLEALRREFDASFELPPRPAGDDRVALLAIRVGGDAVAIHVRDAVGVLKLGQLVAVPSRRPELLGLVGVRGAVVPVYSLARLTGRADAEPPRWAVLAGRADRIALAFDAFEGHALVDAAQLRPLSEAGGAVGHVAGGVELDGRTRPILDVPAIARGVTTPRARGG